MSIRRPAPGTLTDMSHSSQPLDSLPVVAEELASTPYEVIRTIARGGMAVVFEVEHRDLGKRLVLKLLLAALGDQFDAADRLKVEGRVLTKLQSPHLVEVVDFGRTKAGRPYLVTELLQGVTLHELLRTRGPLPLGEAVEIVLQMLAGLAVVHDARFVHRDIKLGNVFYCDRDRAGHRRVKILDFGIAKIAAEDRDAMGAGAPTADNFLLGTPRFMPPEQALSQKSTHGPTSTRRASSSITCSRGNRRSTAQTISPSFKRSSTKSPRKSPLSCPRRRSPSTPWSRKRWRSPQRSAFRPRRRWRTRFAQRCARGLHRLPLRRRSPK